jgi:hypothetical protein
MASHRGERGQYLIEAGALQLPDGEKWQPRLTLTQVRGTTGLPSGFGNFSRFCVRGAARHWPSPPAFPSSQSFTRS